MNARYRAILAMVASFIALATLSGAHALQSAPGAPTDASLLGGVLRWIDNSDDETGFRITIVVGGTVSEPPQEFTVGANVTEFALPPSAQTSCPDRYLITWDVRATGAGGDSEPARGGIVGECDLLPMPSPAPPTLPVTGAGYVDSSTVLGGASNPTRARESRSGSVTGRLAIDANRNGTLDDGDESLSVATGVNLVYWNRVPDLTFPLPEQTGEPISSPTPWPAFDVSVITNKDGTYALTNLPEGSYTLRIFWAGGFALGATRQSPDLWRAIFAVDAEGNVTAPRSTPEFWPESFKQERIELDADHVWLGPPPDVLLVLPKEAGVVPYPVDAGGSEPAVGSLDVGRAFGPGLPDAGTSGGGQPTSPFPAIGIALVTAAALVFLGWRTRRRGDRPLR